MVNFKQHNGRNYYLFSYPFKIGDKIKIHDKEYPVEGEIEDIKAFYIILKQMVVKLLPILTTF